MAGGALAANHYLINSTKQINPKVLKKLKGRNGATGKTGASGAPGATGATGAQGVPGTPATALWARVSGTGVLLTGSGAVSAKNEKTGLVEVLFNRPVNGCAYIANIGSAVVSPNNTTFEAFGFGYAMVEPDENKPTGVDVELVNEKGILENKPFHLAVFC